MFRAKEEVGDVDGLARDADEIHVGSFAAVVKVLVTAKVRFHYVALMATKYSTRRGSVRARGSTPGRRTLGGQYYLPPDPRCRVC